MSRLSRYLRQHRPGAWLSFLLTSTRFCNALLLIVGFAMFFYAGNLYLSQPGQTLPDSWPPAPPSLPVVVLAGMGLMATLAAAAAQAAASAHSLPLLNIHLALLALLLAGQVCLAAAVATYPDTEGGSRVVPDGGGHSRRHHHRGSTASYDLLALAGVAEVAKGGSGGGGGGVAEAVHLHDGDGPLAGGATRRRALRDALLAYKWGDAVALVVEVLALVLGCLLHSAYMRADERAEDLEEGLLADPTSTTPLLTSRRREALRAAQPHPPGSRTALLPPRVTRDDPWSTRMREQYGLDTSVLSYNPQAAAASAGPAGTQQQQQQQQAGAAGGGVGAAGGGRCVIS